MRAWSFSLGRIFGVDVRLHLLFPLVLSLFMLWTSILGRPVARGVLLWLVLLLAVLVRETARALANAWFGVGVRSLLLLPTGGVQELLPGREETGSTPEAARHRRVLALAGPIASFSFALVLAGAAVAISPAVDLLGQRWISPEHLLRSAVWINVLLGAVNLLPAWPLDGASLEETRLAATDGRGARTDGSLAAGAAGGLGVTSRRLVGLTIAVGLVVMGIVTTNWWILAGGMTVLLFGQAQRQGLLPSRTQPGVLVGEVMLKEFSVLSASATLEDAVLHARHSLQEMYPVVRGGTMVGAIGRQAALETIEQKGNSYVQGTMSRRFETATVKESLATALTRVARTAGEEVSQLVPVLDGDRIVGILTPEHLQRAVGMLNRDQARKRAVALAEDRQDR